MPRLSAAPITLTTEEDQDLRRLSRAHKTPRKLAERATIIVLAAAGAGVRETARQLGIWPKTVRRWRARWLSSPAGTSIAVRLADEPGQAHLRRSRLSKSARSWRWPARCRSSELPLSHWSQSELAREAVRRGIVDSISHGSVGRFLKRC